VEEGGLNIVRRSGVAAHEFVCCLPPYAVRSAVRDVRCGARSA